MSKRYSEQFRRQAVEHVLGHPEQSMASTAKLLGMGYSTLDKWMREYRQGLGGAAAQALTADQQSILALKRENAHLREVNEILKKAHVYFVNNPSLPSTRS
jgi:transposase